MTDDEAERARIAHYIKANTTPITLQILPLSMKLNPDPCPQSQVRAYKHEPANTPAPCPYRLEIMGDTTTLCTCCDACRQQCYQDT